MEKPPLFSVIIVNWNTCALTLQAIRSVYAQGEEGVEVIVVDNASSDDSVERIRTEFP
ncbi:MAG: glycosyltransferase, partial [candidate division KSB1 bacterium]|nr:glycosyltransferase [candidate division KSB1 bacterium]